MDQSHVTDCQAYDHSGCWPVVKYCSVIMILSLYCNGWPVVGLDRLEHCSVNEIYSNSLKFNPFSGHSSFRDFKERPLVMKVHGQTLMAMKSGCKIYTHKCYATLEWPLVLHFKHRIYVAHNLCIVPLENNSARESALKM